MLDPNEQPFLYDHSIAGTPLLPGVMGTETFAQLATAFAPGFRVAAIRNEHFYRAFKFHQMEPQTLYLGATITPAEEGGLVAHCSLKSRSKSGKESVRERERIHFTADVHLTREQLDKPSTSFAPPLTEEMPIAGEQIYKIYFHGPAYKVLDRVQVSGDRAIGLMAESLPPDTEPVDAAALIAPRLLELCFQTVGVWEIKTRGTVALPSAVGVIRTYRQPSDADDKLLYALVEAMNDGRQFDAQVVDEDGHLYLEVASYETVQLPGTVSL
jgi:hypothetical protein